MVVDRRGSRSPSVDREPGRHRRKGLCRWRYRCPASELKPGREGPGRGDESTATQPGAVDTGVDQTGAQAHLSPTARWACARRGGQDRTVRVTHPHSEGRSHPTTAALAYAASPHAVITVTIVTTVMWRPFAVFPPANIHSFFHSSNRNCRLSHGVSPELSAVLSATTTPRRARLCHSSHVGKPGHRQVDLPTATRTASG